MAIDLSIIAISLSLFAVVISFLVIFYTKKQFNNIVSYISNLDIKEVKKQVETKDKTKDKSKIKNEAHRLIEELAQNGQEE